MGLARAASVQEKRLRWLSVASPPPQRPVFDSCISRQWGAGLVLPSKPQSHGGLVENSRNAFGDPQGRQVGVGTVAFSRSLQPPPAVEDFPRRFRSFCTFKASARLLRPWRCGRYSRFDTSVVFGSQYCPPKMLVLRKLSNRLRPLQRLLVYCACSS